MIIDGCGQIWLEYPFAENSYYLSDTEPDDMYFKTSSWQEIHSGFRGMWFLNSQVFTATIFNPKSDQEYIRIVTASVSGDYVGFITFCVDQDLNQVHEPLKTTVFDYAYRDFMESVKQSAR